MKTLLDVVQYQKSLGTCCGSTEEQLILAGFKAAIEIAHNAEGEMSFTCEISNALQRELNRYLANEKLLREKAMERIGL